MNIEEGLRTPSKGAKSGSTSSPSNTTTRSSTKRATKNAKITNFFTKVNSPLNRNNSNSNHDQSESDRHNSDDLSKDASSSSMKMPESFANSETAGAQKKGGSNKEYVFIIPSSDDDTNVSTKGSTTGRRTRKAPSIHSTNSKSSDGLVLTNTNNELGVGPRKRPAANLQNADRTDLGSNHESPATPTRSSGRDSRSRDSIPEKRFRSEAPSIQASNQNSGQKVNRIQPTMLSSRTKMIDFQSVPSDINMPRDQAMALIEKLFHVKMPEDFFLFWEFAKTINHRKPCSAFSHAYLEWNLVGPYDVLSGLITDFHGFSKENLLRHCRFYYDPPEFQTVILKKDSNITHYGYYRDEPSLDKPIVVMNKAAQNGEIKEVGDNLFTLLRGELDSSIAALSKSSQEIPPLTFSSSSSKTPRMKSNDSINKQSQLEKAKAKQELTIIRDKLTDFCSSHENLSCESWSRTNTRKSKRCAKTLNGVGIVVPTNGDVGYRDLGMTDSKLKTMLTRISDFKDDKKKCSLYKDYHQIITNANMANDECDFGMGLELGLDLFFQGDPYYHGDIEFLLTNAYTLLERTEFSEILKAHLEERKKGDKVSLLD